MQEGELITVESCLDDAQRILNNLRKRLDSRRHRRWRHAFTSLASDDQAVGLLAYYIWRRRARRQM